MPIDLPSQPPSDVPPDLAAAWPLVLKWAASDDVEREELTDAATDGELRDLVAAVDPLFASINAYLDATDDAEHAVPFGDLAQAAMEAGFELERRA